MARRDSPKKYANRSYLRLAPGALSGSNEGTEGSLTPTRSDSTEAVRAHALGVSLDTRPEEDMERFIRMDKERLIDRHKQEVATLSEEIERWQKQAAELWVEVRHRKTTADRLWLTVFGLALVIVYLYMRDIGCK